MSTYVCRTDTCPELDVDKSTLDPNAAPLEPPPRCGECGATMELVATPGPS